MVFRLVLIAVADDTVVTTLQLVRTLDVVGWAPVPDARKFLVESGDLYTA